MFKKTVFKNIFLIFLFLLGLASIYKNDEKIDLKNVVSTETSIIDVEILSSKNKSRYSTRVIPVGRRKLIPVVSGKKKSYTTIIKHDNHTHSINDENVYNYCKDKEGKIVKAELKKYIYKNEKEKHELILILD